MLLTIDAGNTNIVFAVYDGNRQAGVWRCRTESGRTADEYASWLFQLFAAAGLSFADITDAIACSVVPDANFHLRRLCEKAFGCGAVIIGQDPVDTGVPIDVDKPEDVGADRLVNAAAVLAFYRCPAVVVDFGTATTFDVVDGRGTYRGGVIAPGVNLSLDALHSAAARLPKIGIRKPPAVIGRDTVSAMQSGIYWGYTGLIEGTLKRITDELGEQPFIIATGGLASLFAEEISIIETVDPDLTLKGLLEIRRKNERMM